MMCCKDCIKTNLNWLLFFVGRDRKRTVQKAGSERSKLENRQDCKFSCSGSLTLFIVDTVSLQLSSKRSCSLLMNLGIDSRLPFALGKSFCEGRVEQGVMLHQNVELATDVPARI